MFITTVFKIHNISKHGTLQAFVVLVKACTYAVISPEQIFDPLMLHFSPIYDCRVFEQSHSEIIV